MDGLPEGVTYDELTECFTVDLGDETIAEVYGRRRFTKARELAAMLMARRSADPVAWRVKDYADNWIMLENEEAAKALSQLMGALLQPLYARHPETLVLREALESIAGGSDQAALLARDALQRAGVFDTQGREV